MAFVFCLVFFLPRWPFTQTSQDKDAHPKSGIKAIGNRNSKTNQPTIFCLFLKEYNLWQNMYNYCCRRVPSNTLDLWSGTLFLSLSSVMHLFSLSSFKSKLKTHLLFSFFSFYQPITSNACIRSVCVCVRGGWVCTNVWVCVIKSAYSLWAPMNQGAINNLVLLFCTCTCTCTTSTIANT